MRKSLVPWTAIVAALLCSCTEPVDSLEGRGNRPGQPGEEGAAEEKAPEDAPPAPMCPGAGRSYVGIGGADLRASRVDAQVGVDRGRVKPPSAMQSELARVLGAAPPSSTELATAYGAVPPRWFGEPQGSATVAYTVHRVASQGCATLTATDAAYAASPSPASATAECTKWATKAWARRPEQAELDACVALATTATANEPDPRRRWTEVCAAVLSASGFTTY